MRRMIIAALAVASLVGTAGTSVAGVGGMAQATAPSMVTHVQMREVRERDWERDRHCRDWDDRGRACRDHDEGCTRWDMRTHDCRDYARDRWRGIESCRRPGHDRYLNRRNHWDACPRRGHGY